MFDLKLKTDLTDLEELTRKYPAISEAVRVSKITEAGMLLEREVKKRTPHGAGPIHLRDTIHSKTRVSGKKVAGIIGTPIEHGLPVEAGTKPHFPPVDPLQFWVERKLGLTGKAARSVAFAIAATIAREGTEGAHMFEDAFRANEAKVLGILNGVAPEIARRANNL